MNAALASTPATHDLATLRQALQTSTLNEGLLALGDRWSFGILMGAFLGMQRFEQWQTQLQIPRPTLSLRLRRMVELGIMHAQVYQHRPKRESYHLAPPGRALYASVLMAWRWEMRWGERALKPPASLLHVPCGSKFVPRLVCGHCRSRVRMQDLELQLDMAALLSAEADARSAAQRQAGTRGARVSGVDAQTMAMGIRVDRWALLIIVAIVLGCRHAEEIGQALSVARSVLWRRLRDMVACQLLLVQPDEHDGRRQIYRLTPASRDLFDYLVCFARWTSEHLCQRAGSIAPVHRGCAHAFVPEVVCSHCEQVLLARDVRFGADAAGRPAARRSSRDALEVAA